ncbi:7719_t:CDS:2 [Funneliformis caledonium]|uniref:7719_t:CDS:1 n=1 Tax=Funneliformis caledonium TaxID=1117310 RepID=A0A9N9AL22_9GLOM|nr:7719_t:CDS:2 [Funneliformis caledonium]
MSTPTVLIICVCIISKACAMAPLLQNLGREGSFINCIGCRENCAKR